MYGINSPGYARKKRHNLKILVVNVPRAAFNPVLFNWTIIDVSLYVLKKVSGIPEVTNFDEKE